MLRLWPRAAALLVAVVGVSATAMVAAPPASAATKRCDPVTYHFDVHEGGMSLVVGTISVVGNACVTSGKHGLTSSSGKLKWAASALGASLGWEWLSSTVSLVSWGATVAKYQASGGLQLCTGWKIVPLCGNNEMFSLSFTAYGPAFTGHRVPPAIKCANSRCRLGFTYTGRS